MKLIGWEGADGSTQRGQSIISAIALFTVVGEQDSETNDVCVSDHRRIIVFGLIQVIQFVFI